jgi:1-acyl-sn-glycerol-3-phosphate acyltransferase
LAVQTGTPIVPLAISGTRDALPRGSWRFQHRVHGTLTILPPIQTSGLSLAAVDQVKQHAFEAIAAVLRGPAPAERAQRAAIAGYNPPA